MADNSPAGADSMSALHDVTPAPDLTRDEHLDMAHAHAVAAGQHAGQAAAHLTAARDGDQDGEPGPDDASSDQDDAMPVSAQQRAFGFPPGTGAARSLRTLTGGRHGG